MKFELDHIAIAVDSLKAAAPFYKALGLGEMHTERVEAEKVTAGMFELNNDSRIELVEPMSPDSAIAKFIAKRGPGIHHICLRVQDIRATLKALKAQNIQLINQEPHRGANNCLIAFIHPKATGGVLIELSEPQGEQR